MFLLELSVLKTNSGPQAQQLCITCFKNFQTSFRIIEGTDNWGSDNQGSIYCTIYYYVALFTIPSNYKKLLHFKVSKLGQILGVDKTGFVRHSHLCSSLYCNDVS